MLESNKRRDSCSKKHRGDEISREYNDLWDLETKFPSVSRTKAQRVMNTNFIYDVEEGKNTEHALTP